MRVIIYQSSTGTTERYAKLLAEQTGFPCQPLKSADFSADAEVIFLGWLMSDTLQGLKEVKERYPHLLAVGAVGLFSLTKPKAEIEEKLNAGAPLVLLPGCFDPHKMKGMVRMMIGMMLKAVKKQLKEDGNEKEMKALQYFEDGFDAFDADALLPLLRFLNGEPLEDVPIEFKNLPEEV